MMTNMISAYTGEHQVVIGYKGDYIPHTAAVTTEQYQVTCYMPLRSMCTIWHDQHLYNEATFVHMLDQTGPE
jgi:hypothetical protein